MGLSFPRLFIALALSLTLPLGAQDDAYKAQYQINYKRFTRGDDPKIQDEAWGRLEWFRERMGGDLGPEFAQHLLREAEKERTKHPQLFRSLASPELPAAVGGTAWTSLGPTTAAFAQNGSTLLKVDSGRLRVILPASADTIYVLASGGGLWKTTNFTSAAPTWTPLTDDIGSTMSGSAAFGLSTSTLYVGAGDPFDSGVGGFMVKSTDGGINWSTAVLLGSATKIYDIKVETSQSPEVVLVGTDTGLFRSTDGGSTYANVASIPAAAKVWSLVKTNTGWLASITTISGTSIVGSLYQSTNQGAAWTAVSATALNGTGRITLGVGAPGDATVYAYAANTSSNAQLDLLRSTDGGATWTALAITSKTPTNAASNTDNPTMDLMGTQAWYNHMLLVDPADASRSTVYLGGQLASARTVDGGATWTLLSNWMAQFGLPYIHADFHCAAVLGSRLYFGTDGGIFTSTDGGTTWDDTKNTGLVNHLIYSLAANASVPGSALVGMQDLGTRIRSGLSSTFNAIRGGDGFGVAWSQANNAASLSSYVYNSIKRSTTNPVTDQAQWSSFVTGLGSTATSDNGTSYYFATPLISPPATADPTGQVFFTYGNGLTGTNSKKIFKSSSSGWTTIFTAPTTPVTDPLYGRYVRAVSHGIGVSPTDLQHIAAAGAAGYLLLTTDGGTTWSATFLGAVNADGTQASGSLVTGWKGYNSNIAWANNNLLYVCSESPLASSVRVVKSTNGGGTWAAAANGLPDIPITKLAVDPGDATGNTVYAATWLGVYRTTNGGSTWSLFGTGLPQGRVTDLWVAPDSSVLRVSTWGRGVWEMTTPTPVVITTQPSDTTVAVGHTATFTIAATGSGAPIFQWKRSGVVLSGATGTSYTTGTLALTDSGASFTCEVTGPLGTVASNAAVLTVQALGTATSASSTTVTAIPDATSTTVPGAAVEVPFLISGFTGTLGEVTFSLYLTHTYVGDLVITLVAPDNSTVILSNNAGGGSGATSTTAFGTSCSGYTVFSDLGATSIDTTDSSTAAIVGTFRPSSPLSAFTGKNDANTNGTWKLRLQDVGPADTGSFRCGVLAIKPLIIGAGTPAVFLTPTTATVVHGGAQPFTPTVTLGTANTVTWTASAGSIGAGPTSTGTAQVYTAPGTGTSATVTATTVDTPAGSATAAVTLVAPSAVAVTVTPATLELMTGSGTKQFAVAVSTITNTAITWSGTGVSASGLFSASGLAGGTYPVTATSQSLASLTGSATVTLVAPSSVSVAVTPTPTTVLVGATKQFTATVGGLSTSHQEVNWSVDGGGSMNPTTGLFTATTAGTYTVYATNTFSGRAGTATVSVTTPAAVTLSPTTSIVVQGGIHAFTPTVTGGTAGTVTWTASAGSIAAGPTASGAAQAYTAPGAGSSATVTATTVDAPAGTASATVSLVAPSTVAVTVTPASLELMTGTGTQLFSAAVSTITNKAVTWSGNGVGATGLFSASGLAGGTYPITATSQSLASLTGSATVTLVAPSSVSVAVTPTPTTVFVGATKQFTAAVGGLSASHQGVTWSVSGGGTISSSGLFTATTAGSFTVTATNTFSGVQGTAPVTVQVPVAISSFAATKATLTAGSSTSLSWVVTNSTSQAIDNGVGAVAATGTVAVSPAATTTYTLTAQGLGGPITRSVTITVVAPASISSFTVTPTIVLPNRAATLAAVFTGGTGVITPGIGAVTSGVPITTPLLSAGTTYTLTVTNGAGDPVTATATVAVSGSLNFDLNIDGTVDLMDLLTFAKHYGTTTVTALALADFNSDGKVDDLDLAILLAGL